MKAVLDHIGIAVRNLDAALAFYRDALGLEVEAPEEVPSARVRAQFIPVGEAGAGPRLELLEATAGDSPIAKYLDQRGPGLHHITLRVDDIVAALAQLTLRGARLIDESPRPGAEGSLVAFIHPSSAHGVLVELKEVAGRKSHVASPSQVASESPVASHQAAATLVAQDFSPASLAFPTPAVLATRYALGDLELISLSDGLFRVDGGAIFGIVPRPMWSARMPPDERNRIRLAIRPLLVRGVRTMLIDAGLGDKQDEKAQEHFGIERARHLDHALAEAGVRPEEIDIVLATHLHLDHAGGFTVRDAAGRLQPRFPRARYVARRGEWEDATHLHDRNRGSYRADDFLPLAEAGVLELVGDDQTIMPGVRVQRTGGHTMHHQMVWIESRGTRAAYPADMCPTTAHVPAAWIAGVDLYPVDALFAKQAFLKEVAKGDTLVFFDHDPVLAAGYIAMENGKPRVIPAPR